MKNLAVIIATYFIVFAAGFGMGAFTMYLKQEPLIFAWMNNAHNWQYQAESNQVASDYYRQNATQNIFVAEQLKEICNNYEAENLELMKQVDLLKDSLHEALNPEWGVKH